MATDGDFPAGLPDAAPNSLLGVGLVVALMAKLALVGVGVFTGYYTLVVLSFAVSGGVLIWALVVRRA